MKYSVMFRKCGCVAVAAQLFTGYGFAAGKSAETGSESKPKDIRMYTVDMAAVYENFYKAKEARESLDASAKTAQESVEKMMNDGRKIIESLQASEKKLEDPSIDAAAKTKIEEELREKGKSLHELEIQINTFRQESDEKLRQQQQAILSEHFSEINKHIEELAKKKSAHFVFNAAGMGVLYSKPEYDITKEVIELVNKSSLKK